MSCSAAPSGDVITAIVRGYLGSGRLRAPSNRPSASSFLRDRSNALRQSPSPSASSLVIANCTSPRAAYTLSRPNAATCMPSSGAAGTRCVSRAHTTQRICAPASRSVKYQCPLRCAVNPVTSPRTHSGGTLPSITALMNSVSVETAIALSGDSPGATSSPTDVTPVPGSQHARCS